MADIQTFKNLQDKVLRWLDEAGDTDTTLALVKDALQEANRKRATQEPWPFMLWGAPEVLTTAANQLYYALHPEYFRPHYFWNRTVQDSVSVYTDSNFRDSGTDPNTDSGDALKMVTWGRTEVAQQPVSASTLNVTSDSGADSAATVTFRGVDAAGNPISETITAGNTGAKVFSRILKVTKNGTWAGTMTVKSDSGVTTNLTLGPTEYGRSYQQVKLLQLPTGAQSIEYDFYRQPQTLSADNDRPDIPTPFEDLLVYDALLFFATYNQYDATVVKLWQIKQSELLLALQQAYSDAGPIDAQPTYTSYIPR